MKFKPLAFWVFGLLMMPSGTTLAHPHIHGFVSQGFVLSEGNNFFGDSTNGSFDFYEIGINGSATLSPELLVSAQGIVRDAGAGEDATPRLDYALIDWRFLQLDRGGAGLRIGRVKNPLGLFNDTRDVVFTRPGILLPQSIYFDGAGIRSLLFSSEGAQFYTDFDRGAHQISLIYGQSFDDQLERKEKSSFGVAPTADVEIKDQLDFQIKDSIDGGRWILAFSHKIGRLSQRQPPPASDIRFRLNVLSAQYNRERFSLTAEYQQTRATGNFLGTRINTLVDGGYVQLDYRPIPGLTSYLRYDARFNDARDRDGKDAAALSGAERHQFFAHDLTLGLGWTFARNWGAWIEGHRIYGTATAPASDNPDGANDPHWTLMTIMLGYRF